MSRIVLVALAELVVALTLSRSLQAQEGAPPDRLGPDEALRLAFDHNPTLRGAVLSKEQAAAAVQAESGLYPLMLQLDGGFTHSSSPSLAADGDVNHRSGETTVVGAQLSKTLPIGTETSFRVEGSQQISSSQEAGGGEVGPGYGLTARLAATQPLLRGAGTSIVKASLDQALKAETLAGHRSRRVASQVATDLLDTYWELWYAERTVEIETKARDLAGTQLDEIETRIIQGDAAPVDALPLQTRLATMEESVVSAMASRDNLSIQLAELIGFTAGENRMMPDTSELPPSSTTTPDLEVAIATALANSPEIREQLATIDVALERTRTAGEQLRPRLDLMGWLEANTLGNGEVSPAFEQYSEATAYSAFIGLLYEIPLDNTRKDALRASARLDVDIATQQLVVTRDQVRGDVLMLVDRISSARTRLALAEKTLEVARQQAAAENERFNLGAAIYVQVREAQEAVRQADLRTIRARVDLVQAQIELDHLTGKTLEKPVLTTRIEAAQP